MSTLAQTASWLVQGFTGRIPVWDSQGREVGYRTSYNSNKINLNPGYTNLAPNTSLYSKDFWGNDIAIKSGTPVKAPDSTIFTPAVMPVVTSTQQAVDLVKQPALPVALPLIAGSAAIVLLLMQKK